MENIRWGLPCYCLSLEKRVYSPTACLCGCSHGKATGLNAQGLHSPAQTAHSCGAQKPGPPLQQLSVGSNCGPLTIGHTLSLSWTTCLDSPANPWVQPAATKSPGVSARHSTHGPPLPLGLLPVQHICFAFGQPLAEVIAFQWYAFISVPITPIAPSSHAGTWGKEEGSHLQPRLYRHPTACEDGQGYSEPQESEIPGGVHTAGLCGMLPAAHRTTDFLLPPSKTTSGSSGSAFGDNFQEGLSRNPISSLAGGKQTRQSLLQGTSYSSVLGLEAFVCIKGGGRLATINPVHHVILFY